MNNEIRFLVATDVHLGHKEKHPVRKDDSYEGLEEVLENAKKQDVDFLLLGGDLFDEVNPSKQCFFKCLNILRGTVFGNKEVSIEVSLNGEQFNSNFSNKIVNISLPIFTIHGNHDYPSNQFGRVSACDLLQASNYVNYFGKMLSLHNILIKPLIIKKKGSTTKIALYGLGYIKDPILNDLFEDGKAIFEPPQGDIKEYFTIFVLHQNRYKKKFRPGVPVSNSFSPKNIPEWINLTIWGHQHQAIYKIQSQFDRQIFQPGSTVLTSFIQAEAVKKQCALITINNNSFKIQPILLQRSFRPMFCMNYQVKALKEQFGEDFNLQNFLFEHISHILSQSNKEHPHKKPIIRIKVEYTGLSEIVRLQQIQSKFSSSVANGEKIVIFWKRKEEKVSSITDQELFSNIRNKKIITAGTIGINEEVEMLLKQNIDKIQFGYYPRQFFTEFNSMVARQSGNSSALGRKRCSEIDARNRKASQDKLSKMNEFKETEFKKAMKYWYQKKNLVNWQKLPSDFNRSKQQFLMQEENIMNSHKFKTHCKIMEEGVGFAQDHPKHGSKPKSQKEPTSKIHSQSNNSSRVPAVKRKRSYDVDSDKNDKSESEDCCQRAMKQNMDQDGNKLRFFEAQKKIQRLGAKYLKMNDNPRRLPPPKDKTVRFSSDFY